MNTVLLPTDFSQNSYNAIKYALNLFKYEECRFVLINAYQTPKAGAAMIVSIEDLLQEESQNELGKFKAKLSKELYSAVMDIELESHHGDVVSVLKRMATKYKADIVAMGTKGASGLKGIFVGSVTAAVMKSISLPLVVVPSDHEFEGVKRIGLAWDGANHPSAEVFEPLIHLAKVYDAEVDIVHVNKPEEMVTSDGSLSPDINYMFRKVEHHYKDVENDDVEEGLRSFIEQNDVSLMAMISRKHDWLDRLLHGSYSAQMLKETEVPMLILRADD